MVSTKVIEDLFAADFFYLQQLYNKINQLDTTDAGLQGEAQGATGKPGLLQFTHEMVDGRLKIPRTLLSHFT